MTHYKGRTSPKAIEHDFPHHVEMIVPLGGFGKKLDVMHEWHRAREALTQCTDAGAVMRKAAITFDGALLVPQ